MKRQLHAGRKSKKHAQLIKHGTAQATIRMKPSFEKCSSCETTLIQVEIPSLAREHVIEGITVLLHLMKKFIRSDRCFSKMPYHHSVSLIQSSSIFDQVCKQVGKKDIYHYSFDFPVGVFPNRQGGFYETNTIKIVCNYTICRRCKRHWPSSVVTIYPCMKPFV